MERKGLTGGMDEGKTGERCIRVYRYREKKKKQHTGVLYRFRKISKSRIRGL